VPNRDELGEETHGLALARVVMADHSLNGEQTKRQRSTTELTFSDAKGQWILSVQFLDENLVALLKFLDLVRK
jgi:hypothetical protein